MGKILIVYYSLEGSCRLIAKSLAEASGGDLIEVEYVKPLNPMKNSKFIIGGMQTVFKLRPAIKPIDVNLEDYELIIIGTPVWAGSFTPPIRTFLSKHKIRNKKVALFCCYGGDEGKCIDRLKEQLHDNECIGSIGFKQPAVYQSEEAVLRAKKWIEDLFKF